MSTVTIVWTQEDLAPVMAHPLVRAFVHTMQEVQGSKTLVVTWDHVAQLWMGRNGGSILSYLFRHGLLPQWSLHDLNLYRLNFNGVRFHGNLFRTRFKHMQLRGANFSRCDLKEAQVLFSDAAKSYFQSANLFETRLIGSKFNTSIFVGASLLDVDMRGSSFINADFRRCDLSRCLIDQTTSFAGALYPHGPLPQGWERTEDGRLHRIGGPTAVDLVRVPDAGQVVRDEEVAL